MRTNLLESSVGRIFQHLSTQGTPVLIISSFRHENSNHKAKHSSLGIAIRNAGFGYIKVVGHWVEKGEFTEVSDGMEDSYMVMGDVNTEKRLLNLGIQLGKKYNQEAILFKDSRNMGKLYFMDGGSESLGYLKVSDVEKVKSFLLRAEEGTGDGYSTYKQNDTVFKFTKVDNKNDGWLSKMGGKRPQKGNGIGDFYKKRNSMRESQFLVESKGNLNNIKRVKLYLEEDLGKSVKVFSLDADSITGKLKSSQALDILLNHMYDTYEGGEVTKGHSEFFFVYTLGRIIFTVGVIQPPKGKSAIFNITLQLGK